MIIHDFIKKHPYLVWSTQNYDKLSEAAIVEAVLNYGDFDDVQELFSILGIKKVAEIFREQTTNRQRINYDDKIRHYFSLYFNKYAQVPQRDSHI